MTAVADVDVDLPRRASESVIRTADAVVDVVAVVASFGASFTAGGGGVGTGCGCCE